LPTQRQPGSLNPYVPWGGDPAGALLGPLGLLVMLRWRRRRKGGKMDLLLLLLVMGLAFGLSLAACNRGGPVGGQAESPPPTESQTPQPSPSPSKPGGTPLPPTISPTPTPTCTPTGTPTGTPTLIYLGEWKITHYNYAMENDPQFPADDRVTVSGLDQSKTYRRQFIYSFAGIYGQGTGVSESGEYITIDHMRNLQEYGPGWIDTNPAFWYFTYGKGGSFKEGTPWASVAIAQTETQLRYGDKVKIALYADKIFEVTDTGTFPDTSHLDVFIGADTYANALRYGTQFNVSVWKVVGG
jgi:3D (Asp-Asp-Asp) domain-containing protein